MKLRLTLLAAISVLLLASCSLAADVTPPPGFENVDTNPQPVAGPTTEAVVPQDSGLGYPTTLPSVAKGASIYAQNCTRCHGPSGRGDGPMSSQIEFPLPDFTDSDLAFKATPANWFAIITNGKLERLMPPWKDSLSEEQRWNLVAYLYSLSAPADFVAAGKPVYDSNCAQCHSEAGKGDGPEASGAMPDLTHQQFMAAKSNSEFFNALTGGAQLESHNFADQLSKQELTAVVEYVRAFSYDSTLPEIAKGTVAGALSNGTAGGSIPAGQPVVLHVFDNFNETDTITSTVKSDGTFEFAGIDLTPDRALIVSARYNEVLYTSDVGAVTPDQPDYQLPITIFESTTDSSALSVERMHIVFEFSAGFVQVGELFVISNNSDQTFASETAGGLTTAFPLPQGYTDLGFQDGVLGDRYQQTADGFADTAPVRPGPGSRQILVSFKLPYTDSLTFTQEISYPSAAVNILLPDAGITLSGNGITDEGVQDVQGSGFHSYTISDLQAGDTITFDIKGKPSVATDTPGGQASTPNAFDMRSLLIGILSLALVASIVAYGWVQRGSPAAAPAKTGAASKATRDPAARREALLREIAELDEGFEAGEYPEADYRKEREKLKAELRKLMGKE